MSVASDRRRTKIFASAIRCSSPRWPPGCTASAVALASASTAILGLLALTGLVRIPLVS